MNTFIACALLFNGEILMQLPSDTLSEDPGDGIIDPNFYLGPAIEYDGHLWRAILLEHHPECKCYEGFL